MNKRGFTLSEIIAGEMYTYHIRNYETKVFGFTPHTSINLPRGYTHFGFISEEKISVFDTSTNRTRILYAGDFFSIQDQTLIESNGQGIVISAKNYHGLNIFGGPIEEKGRLKYIDGCTNTLLVHPVRKGDPCLNHLHFPRKTVQTPHTHPSIRIGIVYKGRGECIIPEFSPIPLIKNTAFIIKPNAIHSFNTTTSSMDVIAFHPDSDVGMTDSNHPMINRTIINRKSATEL